MIFYIIGIIILVSFDQLTKYLTVLHIPLHEKIEVIPGILSFTYYQNTGAAWNILEGQMIFFYIITIIVTIVLGYLLYKEGQKNIVMGILLMLMISGALGNFIDRLFHQYVIDMIQLEFINFPIFNLADSYLTVGAIGLMIYVLFEDVIKSGKSDK